VVVLTFVCQFAISNSQFGVRSPAINQPVPLLNHIEVELNPINSTAKLMSGA